MTNKQDFDNYFAELTRLCQHHGWRGQSIVAGVKEGSYEEAFHHTKEITHAGETLADLVRKCKAFDDRPASASTLEGDYKD